MVMKPGIIDEKPRETPPLVCYGVGFHLVLACHGPAESRAETVQLESDYFPMVQ